MPPARSTNPVPHAAPPAGGSQPTTSSLSPAANYPLADRTSCSIARSLEVVGDMWSVLVLREMFLGTHRFDQIQDHLGIARNILAARLRALVANGILSRHQYQPHPPRFEYHLTRKGVDLYPLLIALLQWGDRYLADSAGGPVVLEHAACGHVTQIVPTCGACGERVTARDMRARTRAT